MSVTVMDYIFVLSGVYILVQAAHAYGPVT